MDGFTVVVVVDFEAFFAAEAATAGPRNIDITSAAATADRTRRARRGVGDMG
jgi:hypothetical protein